jgi:hypothetical protein
MSTKQKIMAGLFAVLYVMVALVSFYHAIEFFSMANAQWLGIILALAFEIGQACVLAYILVTRTKSVASWALMSLLTIVQCIGNVFSSHMYLVNHSQDKIQYFVDSVLFFVADPDPKVNIVMIDYICGFLLPIVALAMTSMVVHVLEPAESEAKQSETINPQIFM